ncbi:MAG: hypothetical protein LBE20_00460 [Deltaproteobacteria bacterium]|jgi:hypothetical protein|nr:hypothetical protein [Deltaproteobacteria bacterium]
MGDLLLKWTDKLLKRPQDFQNPAILSHVDILSALNDIQETAKLRKKNTSEEVLLKIKKEILKISSAQETFIYGSSNSAIEQFLISFIKAYPESTIAVSFFSLPYIANFVLQKNCQIFPLEINPLTLEPNYSTTKNIAHNKKVCIIIDNLCGLKDSLAFAKPDNCFVIYDASESFLDNNAKLEELTQTSQVFSIFSLGLNYLDGGGICCYANLDDLPKEFRFLTDDVQNINFTSISFKYLSYSLSERLASKSKQEFSQTQATSWQMLTALARLRKLDQQKLVFLDNLKTWHELLTGNQVVQPFLQRKLELQKTFCPIGYPIILPNREMANKVQAIFSKLKINIEKLSDRTPISKKNYDLLASQNIIGREYEQSYLIAQKTIILPIDTNTSRHEIYKAYRELSKEFSLPKREELSVV